MTKCTHYTETIENAEDLNEKVAILRQGMAEVSIDISRMVNKWQHDMPILLSALRSSLPQIERIAGEDGVKAANELGKITGTICMQIDDQ